MCHVEKMVFGGVTIKKRGAGSSDHVWSNKSGKLSRDTKYSVQADSETLYPLRYYWHSMVRISLSTPTLPLWSSTELQV